MRDKSTMLNPRCLMCGKGLDPTVGKLCWFCRNKLKEAQSRLFDSSHWIILSLLLILFGFLMVRLEGITNPNTASILKYIFLSVGCILFVRHAIRFFPLAYRYYSLEWRISSGRVIGIFILVAISGVVINTIVNHYFRAIHWWDYILFTLFLLLVIFIKVWFWIKEIASLFGREE